MDVDFEKFVQDLKDRNDLIDVIEATSNYRFQTRKVGRYVKCQHPDSLMVDPDWGVYTWFANVGKEGKEFETGDHFHWLERYANMDFMQACEWLAARAGMQMLERKKQNGEKTQHAKIQGEIFEIAAQWFQNKLWATPAALDYCHRRGWTDETIKRARLGFTPGLDFVEDLRGELSMRGVNLEDAASVSLTGRRGNVLSWLNSSGIVDFSEDWVKQDFIPGMGTGLRLVYPHLWRGRVMYFSSRNLVWAPDGSLINRPEKDENGNHFAKSYNLPRSLVGERRRYFNFEFRRGADICFVVEGQPDALSAAQLGFSAVALAGVGVDNGLADLLVKQYKIKRIFVGLDNDKAGQKNRVGAALLFGAMTRMITWDGQVDGQVTEADNEES